ncbi:hypothetical protein CXB77_05375 (plasmid) [Chromatium okenii]|jgi:hypothetical protein|uniref:Uncharacterized protein n=2 Tax=Chromatium okenii TaxID=61644 RepID=A0A2S7XT77_9GAMM|nr:hypothetical protein CXB77_18740 [Chromatium okenii]PQJ96846.1 hypothetical protein CXB77_05375 [Chromatium okenii]
MMRIASGVVMPEITATQPTYWFPSYIDYIDYEEIQRLYCDDDESLPTDMNPSAIPAEWSQFNDDDIPF